VRYRFVHAADLHLDTPFEGIGRVDARVAAALRDASLQALEALADLAIERQAEFLLVAGDVYDGAERGVRAQLAFRRAVDRLARAGIETFVVHGNHDPLHDGWTAVRSWPMGVHVFGAAEVEHRTVERDGEVLARIHGISYARRDTVENLALRFSRDDDDALQIGLLHANVGGDPAHAAYSPCTVDHLQATGIDYWALGHVHGHAVLRDGAPWIVYPGSLQGRSPHAGERGAKGAYVVEVDDGAVVGVEHVALDRVRFAVEDVDVDGVADVGELEGLLADRGAAAMTGADGRSVLLRVRLVGRGPVHADRARDGALGGLLEALRAAAPTARPFLWWEGVRDGTRPQLDRAAIAARGDFASELLALAGSLERDELARGLALAEWLGARPGEPDDEALAAAVDLALDLVTGDER
jgi:DNA repair exonuclease SbcCD nuclease subunit